MLKAMKKGILTLSLILIAGICFAGGYNFSELEEVVDDFEGIFVVNIKNIRTEEVNTHFVGKVYYFQIIEVIKGVKPEITRAVHFLPPYTRVSPDAGEVELWVKLKGSGKELSLERDQVCIMYFTKQGLNLDNGILMFQRVDDLDKKEELLELLRNEQ